MARSAKHNPGRSLQPAYAGSRPARLALALLVGLALTSICQGHDSGEHRLAPHLAFLAEAEGHAAEESYAPAHTGTEAVPMYTIAGPAASGAHDVASLGAALPLLALFGLTSRRRWPRPGDARPCAHTPLQPDPPPPRPV